MTVVDGYGFILLSRKTFKEFRYWTEGRAFSKFEAWLDLIQSAAYSDHERTIRGRDVAVPRGSLIASERYLLRRWRWKSVGKVRRFLDALVNDGCILRDAKTEQITLLNYAAYQGERSSDGAVTEQSRSSDGAVTEQRRKKGEEREEGEQGKRTASCPEPAGPASGPPAPIPDDPVVMDFPAVANDGKPWLLRASKLGEYQDSFPHLEVGLELRAARQWCIDNPQRRKTANGMPAFLSRWLKKAQNDGRGGGRAGRPPTRRPPPGAFGADDQRRQQAADLDKELGLR